MKLAIDASRCTVARQTGTEHYARQLVHHLIVHNEAQPQPHAITLYFRDAPPPNLFPSSPHVTYRVIPFKRAWTHVRLAWAIARDKPDLTFVPAHTLPFVLRGAGAVTVHDLGYKLFPQAHPRWQRLYLDWTTRYSARRARVVLADSQATRDDLARFYGIPTDKVRVVYAGVDAPTVLPCDLRAFYGIDKPYVLFIGTLQPRKNIAGMIQAYATYRQRVAAPVDFVLAGGKGWLFDEAWVRGVDGVKWLGYIDEAHKGALLAGAQALLFATLYEGFGFPVLEAMHCGTPVIAANTSSLPELVGDAGVLVDPTDTSGIAAALVQVLADDALRAELIQRGRAQAARFTWERAAAVAYDALVR